MNESNVELEYYYDVNGEIVLVILPKGPQNLVFKGAGARGLGYVGAFKVFEEKLQGIQRVIGSSAGACTACYYAIGMSSKKFEEISRNKDLRVIEELKHRNAITVQEKKPSKKTHKPKQPSSVHRLLSGISALPRVSLANPAQLGKTTYSVSKGIANLVLSDKHGIYSGKKIAEEINADLCEHVKTQITTILADAKNEEHRQQLIADLAKFGPLKDFNNGIVTLKTFTDVLMQDHLPDILKNLSQIKQQKIMAVFNKANQLRTEKQKLTLLNKISKTILNPHLEKDAVVLKELRHFLDEFIQFEYMLNMEVLTFGQFNHLLTTYKKDGYDFRSELHIAVSNRTKNELQIFNHDSDPHLPIGIATEMSMSIPIVFKRPRYKSCYHQDGGVEANCPARVFDAAQYQPLKGEFDQNLRTLTVRMENKKEMQYLWKKPQPPAKPKTVKDKIAHKVITKVCAADVVTTWYNEAEAVHSLYPHRTIQISDEVKTTKMVKGKLKETITPVSSVEFKLTDCKKDQLIQNGVKAATEYFKNYAGCALATKRFTSHADLKARKDEILKELQAMGANLPPNTDLLKILENKLSNDAIPTDKLIPRGSVHEREEMRQSHLKEIRDITKPIKRIKFYHPGQLPKADNRWNIFANHESVQPMRFKIRKGNY